MFKFRQSKLLYFTTVILISMVFAAFIERIVSMPKDSIVFNNSWTLVNKSSGYKRTLPNTFVIPFKKDSSLQKGLNKIVTTKIIDEDATNLSIVIIQQPNFGFRITLDGIYIAEVGDVQKGWGNIWKASGIFPIPFTLKKGEHTLTLEIYDYDELSLLNSPYLINTRNYPFKYFIINFLNSHLGTFMMGTAFILGFLLISLALKSKNRDSHQLFLGIAFILWSIYFIDFQSVEFTIVSYMTYQKILMSCFAIGCILNIYVVFCELTETYGGKLKLFFGLYLILCLSLIIFPMEITFFRNSLEVATALCLLLLLPVMLHPKVLHGKEKSLNYIITGVVAASYFAFRYIFYEIVRRPHTQLSHIGLFVYLIFIFIYFLTLYFEKIDKMLHDRQRADHYFNESVIDSLTRINNRKIIEYIDFSSVIYSIIILDVDNFKAINDTFGHDIGDEVLKVISSIIKTSIRESDYTIRLGGDEFVVLLKECPDKFLEIKSDEIWGKFSTTKIEQGNVSIPFGCSGGVVTLKPGEDFTSGLRRADLNLYNVKKSKKGDYLYT